MKNEPSQAELLRRRSHPPPRKSGWLSYDEFLAWAAANGKPTRPIGFFEQNPTRHTTAPDKLPRNPMGQHEPDLRPRPINDQEKASLEKCLATERPE